MGNMLKVCKTLEIFLTYFILVIVFSLPNGLQTKLSSLVDDPLYHQAIDQSSFPLLDCGKSIYAYSTADDYIMQYGGMDMVSYVKGALQIVDNKLLLSPKL